MSILIIQESIALVLLLVLSGLFSSAETIFFSLNPLQLRRITEKHPAMGARLHQIVSNPNRLLSTILIGNTIINVATAAVGFAIANNLFKGYGEIIAIPVVTLLLIIFGEVAPKRIGLYYAETLSLVYAPIISFITLLLTPLRMLLERIT